MQIEFKRASNSYILISIMRVANFYFCFDFIFIFYLISILMMRCTAVPKNTKTSFLALRLILIDGNLPILYVVGLCVLECTIDKLLDQRPLLSLDLSLTYMINGF